MALQLSVDNTALVLIDLQKGILGQSLAPYSAADCVNASKRLLEHFRRLQATIVVVHVGFSDGYKDRLSQKVDSPMPISGTSPPSDWSDFVDGIADVSPDIRILKRQWGAFHGTELDLQLRRRGISTIVLGGVATNFGVEQTAREAWQHNYSVVLAEDACTSVNAEMHSFSIKNIMPRLAEVSTTDSVIKALTEV